MTLHVTHANKKPSCNHNRGVITKFGIKVPRNTCEALLFDCENKNTKWAETILKEMTGLYNLKTFEFHPPTFKPGKDYQFASLHFT